MSPNKSLENRRENAGAFPASQLQRYVWREIMELNINVLLVFLGIFIFALFAESIEAVEPVPEKVENAILKTVIKFSDSGDVVLTVRKLIPDSYEPEEMARLLSHWYSKILYLLPSPMPRMFLMQQSHNALFEPKIKPKDNILKKAQIDDVINLSKSIEKGRISSSISLYLQELPNGQRGLVSHISGDTTEQQTVFSWAVILHHIAQNYHAKDISFIHDVMGETIKAYSAGADLDNVQNTVIVPNNSFFKIKQKR